MLDKFKEWILEDDWRINYVLGIAIFVVGTIGYFLEINERVFVSGLLFLLFYVGYRFEKKEHPDRKYEHKLIIGIGVILAIMALIR